MTAQPTALGGDPRRELVARAIPADSQLMASALAGDRRALERLVSSQVLGHRVAEHALEAALAPRVEALGLGGSNLQRWQAARRDAALRAAALDTDIADVAAALGGVGTRWVLGGGAAVARELDSGEPSHPVERLDLLVEAAQWQRARDALVAAGWRPPAAGALRQPWLVDEGAEWRAGRETGPRLCMRFRLAPWLPDQLLREILQRARPDSGLGSQGHRLQLADAYLMACLDVWERRLPRRLDGWWELHRIGSAGGREMTREVYREARRLGLQLPVGVAAAVAAALWRQDGDQQVAQLLSEISFWERGALRLLHLRSVERIGVAWLVWSRLLTGRRTRLGWRCVTRAVWAHPAVVADETSEGMPWPLRRALHALRSVVRLVSRPHGSAEGR